MGVLSDSMRAHALVPLTTHVELLAPTTPTNPHLTNQTTVSWATPTVTRTVLGTLQPAGTRALERAARIGKAGVHELITEPASLTPQSRVRIGTQQYVVLDVRERDTHTHAIVEEVNT